MSKKVDIELPNEESGAGSPQQPASPESEHDNKGDVSGAATKSTLKKKKSSASGVVKSFPEKSSASGVVKSFSESLAARPERSLAETYRVEEGIPDNVIEWSVSVPFSFRCVHRRLHSPSAVCTEDCDVLSFCGFTS
jgi:hypothetical protein